MLDWETGDLRRNRVSGSPVDDLLKLPGMTVERYSQVEGCIFFELKILAAQVNCYRCSQSSQELHRRTTILVRDLPAFGQPVYLRVPRRQFYCRHCQKYFIDKSFSEAI